MDGLEKKHRWIAFELYKYIGGRSFPYLFTHLYIVTRACNVFLTFNDNRKTAAAARSFSLLIEFTGASCNK